MAKKDDASIKALKEEAKKLGLGLYDLFVKGKPAAKPKPKPKTKAKPKTMTANKGGMPKKKKGYAKGGMKKKGFAAGGMKKKGYAKGGMKKKGYAKGGAAKKTKK